MHRIGVWWRLDRNLDDKNFAHDYKIYRIFFYLVSPPSPHPSRSPSLLVQHIVISSEARRGSHEIVHIVVSVVQTSPEHRSVGLHLDGGLHRFALLCLVGALLLQLG